MEKNVIKADNNNNLLKNINKSYSDIVIKQNIICIEYFVLLDHIN